MNPGLLILRLVVGVLFVGHGAQKLFGWFGGHGREGTGSFFESLGLRPGRLIALGLLTPVAPALLIAVMSVAVATVHWSKGVWATGGGFEYNLVLVSCGVNSSKKS
jgi:putative oxidoreductase